MKELKIKNTILVLTIGDITKQETDAIVNAANKKLAPGGGVAGAIHRAAGPKLWDECKKLGGCKTGEAKITKGYNVDAKYIIHTVGPVYSNSQDDPKKLSSCYIESLKLAETNNIKSISFPALSTGYFGYPINKAARVAFETITNELNKGLNLDLVKFVLYNQKLFDIHKKAFDNVINQKT